FYFALASALRKEILAGLTVADLLLMFLTMFGCVGCYPLWPVALGVMTLCIFMLASRTPGLDPRRVRQAGVTAVLFLLTWFECASVYQVSLQGFAERVEERVGEAKLMAWAEELIAARKQRKDARENDP